MPDPIPYNNYYDPVKLTPGASIDPPIIQRDDIVSGRVPVLWGPGQPFFDILNDDPDTPFSPTHWPASVQVLKLPIVIRYLWEDPIIEVLFDIWQGYSGNYGTPAVHTTYFDQDLVNTDPSFFPSHVHQHNVPFPFGSDGTFRSYAIEGLIGTFTGGKFGWSVSGGFDDWQVPSKINLDGPLGWLDYVVPHSALAAAIQIAADLWIGGSVDRFHPPDFGSPIGVEIHYTGLDHVGVGKPVFLQDYTVDEVQVGVELPQGYPLSITIGYTPPPIFDPSNHAINWQKLGDLIKNHYSPDQDVDVFDPTTGEQIIKFPWTDSLQIPIGVLGTVWYELAGFRPAFFGTATIHIIVLSTPRDPMTDELKELIKAQFPFLSGHLVVVFIDTEYLIGVGLLNVVGAIPTFINQTATMCSDLSEVGFVYGGEVGFTHYEEVFETLVPMIDDWLMHFPKHPPFRTQLPTVTKVDGSVVPTIFADE